MTYTDTELHALGFTRQSKTMWRKGDVTYQNGKFYRQGKEISSEEVKDEIIKSLQQMIEIKDNIITADNFILNAQKQHVKDCLKFIEQGNMEEALRILKEW